MKIIAAKLFTATFVTCLIASFSGSAPAAAMPLPEVVSTIEHSGGHYVRGSASLVAADCSGLVSVAQSLAMGEPPHRLGNTHSLLAGQWPNVIAGATLEDEFVIGVSPAHMATRIDGVNVESTGGGNFRVGGNAASPFDSQFTRQFHVDPAVLR